MGLAPGFSNSPVKIRISTMRKWDWERGATAVEYGLFVAFIAAAVILGVTALGIGTKGLFTPVTDFLANFHP
jgi:Flp pilus assembly pilin Flp